MTGILLNIMQYQGAQLGSALRRCVLRLANAAQAQVGVRKTILPYRVQNKHGIRSRCCDACHAALDGASHLVLQLVLLFVMFVTLCNHA